MNIRKKTKSPNGFTLIEVIAVLVLLGILAAVAIPRFVDLGITARERALDAAIAELNSRESLEWGRSQIRPEGWSSDVLPNLDLGDQYDTSALTDMGGNLVFQTNSVTLTREAATRESPGLWTN